MARVLLFGRFADRAGWRERAIAAPTLAALKEELAALGLETPGANVAVDRVIVHGDAALSSQSEVAFLPPMSGG